MCKLVIFSLSFANVCSLSSLIDCHTLFVSSKLRNTSVFPGGTNNSCRYRCFSLKLQRHPFLKQGHSCAFNIALLGRRGHCWFLIFISWCSSHSSSTHAHHGMFSS